MARPKREWVSQDCGSYHLISRVAGGELIFNNHDKEFFLGLLQRLAAGFFVQIHAFVIMSNHFHILVTYLDRDAQNASKAELFRRYKLIFGKNTEPPSGKFNSSNQFIPDEDGGVERLRRRLGSVSRFMQELKQQFSRWYNYTYDRTGYLWGDRFKGIIVDNGIARLM
jgi:REP element-mobilizing transposase RayT